MTRSKWMLPFALIIALMGFIGVSTPSFAWERDICDHGQQIKLGLESGGTSHDVWQTYLDSHPGSYERAPGEDCSETPAGRVEVKCTFFENNDREFRVDLENRPGATVNAVVTLTKLVGGTESETISTYSYTKRGAYTSVSVEASWSDRAVGAGSATCEQRVPTPAPTVAPTTVPTVQPTVQPTAVPPVVPPVATPPVQGRGDGGYPQRFQYCVFIDTGVAATSGWVWKVGAEGDLGPGGIYSGYEKKGQAFRSVDMRFNPIPNWDAKCHTPAPVKTPVATVVPVQPVVQAPPPPVAPEPIVEAPAPMLEPVVSDAPNCVRMDEATGEMVEADCSPAEEVIVPVVPDEPVVIVPVPQLVPWSPEEERKPDSPWYNGSTAPGGDRGIGRG